jgi:hypothetical protein
MGILVLIAICYARTDIAHPIPSREDFGAETPYRWLCIVKGKAIVYSIARLCPVLCHIDSPGGSLG